METYKHDKRGDNPPAKFTTRWYQQQRVILLLDYLEKASNEATKTWAQAELEKLPQGE